MHEGGGAQRRLSGSCRIEFDGEQVADRVPVDRRRLHEEIVRMLPVVKRDAAVALSALEEQRQRLVASERRRLCREHGAKGELAPQQRV